VTDRYLVQFNALHARAHTWLRLRRSHGRPRYPQPPPSARRCAAQTVSGSRCQASADEIKGKGVYCRLHLRLLDER
jgi:hypothetical protein